MRVNEETDEIYGRNIRRKIQKEEKQCCIMLSDLNQSQEGKMRCSCTQIMPPSVFAGEGRTLAIKII